MSVEVITWALGQRVPRSSAKFVLVALANCASLDGVCYPSMAYLSDATEQDRKTVAENIKRLKDWGFIEPTGEHRGSTGQVVVYRLKTAENGTVRPAEKNQTKQGRTPSTDDVHYGSGRHYVYELRSPQTGQFYVGVRTCVGDPQQDTYSGSGRWCKACDVNVIALVKSVIAEYPTRELAEAAEQARIDANLTDPLCMNSPKTGTVEPPPKTDTKRPENGQETPPKTGHGTVRNRQEPSGTKDKAPRCVAVEVLLSAGFDGDTAAEFIAHKQRMKAPLTDRAWADHQREAAKAGWSPMAAAEKVMAKSWRGFEAKYVASEARPNSAPAGEPAWRTEQRERTASFAGSAAAKRPSQPMEVFDVTARIVG